MIEWVLGVAAFFIGAAVGSFLAVVADRLPDGGDIVSHRSRCVSCDRALGPVDMVPVLSYLALRGRCRTCRAGIPLHLWLVEVITGLIFVWVFLQVESVPGMVVMAVAAALFVVVGLIDYQRRLILNVMVLPATVIALAVSPFWNQMGQSRTFLETPELVGSFLNSLTAGVGAFLLFLVILIIYPRGMGGGDVKYVGLIGVLVGFPGVVVALWSAIVVGGVVSAVLLAFKVRGRKDAIPFGPFLSLGAVVGLLATDEIISRYDSLVGS